MRKAGARTALISLMLGGGLLYAGISQAQEANVPAERDAELAAATGGPALSAHLIGYAADRAAVDVREDDVEGQPPVAGQRPTSGQAAESDVARAPRPVTTAEATTTRR